MRQVAPLPLRLPVFMLGCLVACGGSEGEDTPDGGASAEVDASPPVAEVDGGTATLDGGADPDAGDEAASDGGEPAAPSLRIAVLSDLNGSYGATTYGESVHRAVTAIRDALAPDLVLITGDMVAGQKAALDYPAMWEGFHAAVTAPLREAGIPVAPTPGNHDASGYAGYENERAEYARQWLDETRTPEVEFIDAAPYPFRYTFAKGGVFFMSLDATVVEPLDDVQRAWVRSQLEAAADYPVKIVFGHIPLHPVAQEREREIMDDPELEALFAEHGVSVYISGHHHAYYPGQAGGVRQLAMPCAGSGPRALIGTTEESPRGLAVIDVGADGIEALDVLAEPTFDDAVPRESLPPFIYLRRGMADPHVLVRDDLDPGDVGGPEDVLGSLENPIVIDEFPYAVTGDTRTSGSYAFDAYSCRPETNESGPEVVYELTLDAPRRLTAWVEERAPVDVDLHVLTSLEADGTLARDCVRRGHHHVEAELPAGTHYLVVDTWNGGAQAGPYVLKADLVDGTWREYEVAEGVLWRSRYGDDPYGQQQFVHLLEVDTTVEGVDLRAVEATGCQTVGELARAEGAVAAVNGGYFDASCEPVSLVMSDGAPSAFNATTRGAFGIDAEGMPQVARVEAGMTWEGMDEAQGGGPVLVVEGEVTGEDDWAEEDFTGGFLGAHPRTWAGYDAEGHVLFGTVDGRSTASAGMSLAQLSGWLAGPEVEAVGAVNLDGGGSTTFFVEGTGPSGVVNYPADGAPHGVTSAWLVFAPALESRAHFLTHAPDDAAVDRIYVYDAEATDADGDIMRYRLLEGPAGMRIDPETGLVLWAPTAHDVGVHRVRIEADDGRGGARVQTVEVGVAPRR